MVYVILFYLNIKFFTSFKIQFITPWTRGYPFPCQKESDTSKWIARKWWDCDYDDSTKNNTGYYYLPEVPKKDLIGQRMKDSLHTVLFVIGGFIGAYSGQFWYKCLSRLVLFIT